MPVLVQTLGQLLLAHEQLLLGWLLGMLSPAVVEEIRRHRRSRLLKSAIAQELHGVRFLMACSAYVFRGRSVSLTDEFLNWFEQVLDGHTSTEAEVFRKGIVAMRSVPLAQRSQKDSKRGFSLTEVACPLLGAHTNEIALFPIAEQSVLLDIEKNLRFYNEQVVFLRRLFDRTYDKLGEVSRNNLLTNLDAGYDQLAARAVSIADGVRDLPSSLKRKVV